MRTGHGDGHYRVCDAAGQASSATAAEGTRQRPCTESARDASPTENPREARTCLRGDEIVERASARYARSLPRKAVNRKT